MKKKSIILLMSATIGFSTALSGCVPLVLGGAVGTTAFVTTDRRSTGMQMADGVMDTRVHYEITQAISKDIHLTVTTYNGRVLLTGEVSCVHDKTKAQQIAEKSLEVRSVVNELIVAPVTSMTQRMSDSSLATKVRSYLIGTEGISLNQMKVTVDRGIVYLMGLVTAQEAMQAVNVASRVSGVTSVVNVFEIISDEEVNRRLQLLEQNKISKTSTQEPVEITTAIAPTTQSSQTEVRLQ